MCVRFFVHPLFIIVAALAIFYAAGYFFLALIIAVLLHELAHLIVAKHFGLTPSRLALTPFGGAVTLQTEFLTMRQRNLIYLAGPAGSLILTLFFGVLVWLFPVAFGYLEYLVAANFLVGIINILPVYPLDGGKAVAGGIKPQYVLWWSNITFALVLLVSLIQFNFAWIAFAVMILVQINWEYRASTYHDRFNRHCAPKVGKFVQCGVLSSMSLLTAYKMIDRRRPTTFVVIDRNNLVFSERDLEQWLLAHNCEQKIADCLDKISLSRHNDGILKECQP